MPKKQWSWDNSVSYDPDDLMAYWLTNYPLIPGRKRPLSDNFISGPRSMTEPYSNYFAKYDPASTNAPSEEPVTYSGPMGSIEGQLLQTILSGLVDDNLLQSKYDGLFISPSIASWQLRFNATASQPMREYVVLFRAISEIYDLILTLQVSQYFRQRWLLNSKPEFLFEHELRVMSISRASPDDLKLEGIGAGLKAVGEALSIGKQYQEIRSSGEKVKEAKAAARKAELEVAEAERAVRIADAAEAESLRFVIAQKRADLRMLDMKVEEEELKLRRQRRQDMDESLTMLEKHAPVLDKLPPELRDQIVGQLTSNVSIVHDSAFEILEYTESLPAATPPTNTLPPDQS